jgi:hypothetical protein
MLGQRTLQVTGLALTALVGGFALWCGSGDDSSGSGGSSGGGTGGTGGTTGTGGATGTGGSGTATGGAGGSSGATDAGNDSGLPVSCTTQPTTLCTAIPPPAGALIADFTVPEAGVQTSCSGIEGPPAYGAYGGDLFGGTYVYPNYAVPSITLADGVHSCAPECNPTAPLDMYPLHQDLSGGNWHITGDVGNYSGFGIYVNRKTGPGPTEGTFTYTGLPNHLIDASMYSGIAFTISGNVGTPAVIYVNMSSAAITPQQTLATLTIPSFTTCGTCQLSMASMCGALEAMVPVTATPTEQTVSFLSAGIMDPGAFMGVSWRFTNPPGVGSATVTTYPIDVTVDNIHFVP